MPTYIYYCATCQKQFDVVKSMAHYDRDETCPDGHLAERRIARCNFTGASDWNPTYNPAFGCVVKSKKHQRELLAQAAGAGRPMIEIGSEPVENLHKAADRQQRETREKRWSESAEQIRKEVLA